MKTVEAHLRECFGRVVYSHKTHEKCAEILHSRLSSIKLSQILLTALIAGGILSSLLGDSPVGKVVGLALSTILLALNAYTKDYDLGELAQKHRQAAADLWLIREQYLALIADMRVSDISIEIYQGKRDELLERLHSVYTGAPGTTFKAYQKARKALQHQEDMTFTDQEIDAFLPSALRITGRESD